jgi:hypothetical protein
MAKRLISLAVLLLLTFKLAHVAYASAARAEMPEPTPTPEPQAVVNLSVEPTDSPKPMQRPQPTIHDYHVGRDHIEAIARGMWGLNTDEEKRGFTFLIVNRTYCPQLRADGAREWPDSIKGNVEMPGEFFFYDSDAPVSEANYKLAELYINAQITFILTKEYTGYPFPSTMLFMAWDGESLYFMTERGGEPWYYGE